MATTARPWTPTEERIGSVFVKVMSVLNVLAYRATGGASAVRSSAVRRCAS